MSKIFRSLPFWLVVAIILGIIAGQATSEPIMSVARSLQHILGQLILFCVPLIVIGFVAPSITKLGQQASKMLLIAVSLAYISSVLAAVFSMISGYIIIPFLSIASVAEGLNALPNAVFKLDIPQIMPVMSALVLAIFLGLSAAWTASQKFSSLLDEFGSMVFEIVRRIIIPILPFFIGLTFMALSFEGSITKQGPAFLQIILLVILGHFIWLAFLYILAGIYAKKNPFEVLKHYGAAYLSAIGTMSSAASLAVALDCASKSKALRPDMVRFGVPLFANIHLCGSVLTEVFFVMAVSQILYGAIPPIGLMIAFCLFLAIFAIGAPGVPGGTVMASLGLISGLLGFDEAGLALMLAIFALQDSFGTACNLTSDGALTLAISGYADKKGFASEQ